jgi:hypothetical protein
MGLLAFVLWSSGPTLGSTPYSFLPRIGDVVSMVPNLVRRLERVWASAMTAASA